MKRFLAGLVSILFPIISLASHISGGGMYYTLVSQPGNDYTYSVNLKLFRDPESAEGLDASEAIEIYN